MQPHLVGARLEAEVPGEGLLVQRVDPDPVLLGDAAAYADTGGRLRERVPRGVEGAVQHVVAADHPPTPLLQQPGVEGGRRVEVQMHHGPRGPVGPGLRRRPGLHGGQDPVRFRPVGGQRVEVHVDALTARRVPQQAEGQELSAGLHQPEVPLQVGAGVLQVGQHGVRIGLGTADLQLVDLVHQRGDGDGVGRGRRAASRWAWAQASGGGPPGATAFPARAHDHGGTRRGGCRRVCPISARRPPRAGR